MFDNYVIDKVLRLTEVGLTSEEVNWTMTSIESPNWEFTGEAVEKNDAHGVLLASFDTAKGVGFSGEGSLLSAPMLAAQRGAQLEDGATAAVKGETFEVVDVKDGVATLSHTPSKTPKYVYEITKEKGVGEKYQIGLEGGDWAISEAEIAVPTTYEGKRVGVYYEYTTTTGLKITDKADEYATAAKYIVNVLVRDMCNQDLKRACTIVFPKAKIDNNVSINMTTEGTHPFSFKALADYCEDSELCYVLFDTKGA